MASNQASDPEYFDFKLYRYNPSLGAAIAATLIFAVLTSVHLWLLVKAKTRYFVPFLIGGIFQTLGYAGRIWSHFDQDALGGFIMQAILILVAPALFAASIYMILGRLIRVLHAEHLSLIPIKWITRIFVTGDVIAFTLQAAGGGTQSGGSLEMYDLGEKIIIAGLFIQIIVFGFFVATSARFHTRIVKSPTSVSANGRIAWTRHLYVLYATSALILVRSIFRVVEYLQGNDGYLISHEVFIYVMDALLMAAVMAAFALWYMADLQQNEGTKYSGIGLSGSMRDSSTDVELPLKARLGVTQC
ncbi:hypothetical protein LTR56_024723 [Elasticomyces elasticus]|nr:hypothetical protein LTR22_027054 [Elasticomyces elasticus]KAK3618329.1 hypothetical protein LTR56_024723 [Elasticomyces elasticus]